MADDIWIYDPAAKKVENITNNIAQDIIPMWIGEEIYFISDRDRTMNIFVYNIRTKQTEKVTHYTDYDVKFPAVTDKLLSTNMEDTSINWILKRANQKKSPSR